MFATYLLVSLFMGCFMSYAWRTDHFLNVLLKVMFSIHTLWTASLLFGYFMPAILAAWPDAKLF